jgi:hypothetical protein
MVRALYPTIFDFAKRERTSPMSTLISYTNQINRLEISCQRIQNLHHLFAKAMHTSISPLHSTPFHSIPSHTPQGRLIFVDKHQKSQNRQYISSYDSERNAYRHQGAASLASHRSQLPCFLFLVIDHSCPRPQCRKLLVCYVPTWYKRPSGEKIVMWRPWCRSLCNHGVDPMSGAKEERGSEERSVGGTRSGSEGLPTRVWKGDDGGGGEREWEQRTDFDDTANYYFPFRQLGLLIIIKIDNYLNNLIIVELAYHIRYHLTSRPTFFTMQI